MVHERSIFQSILLLAAILAVLMFDLNVELGVAGGVPYVGVVCLSFFGGGRRDIQIVAACCMALTIFGYFASPLGGEEWKIIANRVLALLAIGSTAWFADTAKRSAVMLELSKQGLHDQVLETAATNHVLQQKNEELEQFAYRTSHDLKSPLTTIKGLVRVIDLDLISGEFAEVKLNVDKVDCPSHLVALTA